MLSGVGSSLSLSPDFSGEASFLTLCGGPRLPGTNSCSSEVLWKKTKNTTFSHPSTEIHWLDWLMSCVLDWASHCGQLNTTHSLVSPEPQTLWELKPHSDHMDWEWKSAADLRRGKNGCRWQATNVFYAHSHCFQEQSHSCLKTRESQMVIAGLMDSTASSTPEGIWCPPDLVHAQGHLDSSLT